jgi:copper(I)-binding protein
LQLEIPMTIAGWRTAAVAVFSTLVVSVAADQRPALRAQEAWMRQPARPGQAAGAYLVLINDGDRPVTVVGARSDAASSIEFHEMAMHGDMMHMRHTIRLMVPAKGRLHLKPGGLHLMLMGTTQGVVPGQRVRVVLDILDGAALPVLVDVRPLESR